MMIYSEVAAYSSVGCPTASHDFHYGYIGGRYGLSSVPATPGCFWMGIATIANASSQAPFASSITHVIRLRSEEEMPRVDTAWGVACVADFHSRRDGTVSQFIGQPVSQPLQLSAEPYPAVTAYRRGHPEPTGVGPVTSVHFGPEEPRESGLFVGWQAGDRLGWHGDLLSLCLPRGVVSIAGALSCPIIAHGGANA